ncbi:ABC transporter permease [Pseudohalocynthiibacter aestuariivivens]|jgi:general nucleoside transport system permease protein|uniref:ABC transporter permease n=1 Tax=Pseudohalocynthiibacter aestuariivivens TaxID=1591409 RepID=A0ABV5JCL5_9RHOB|nr:MULTISPECIES: ABC transporter permease [Pseudohalocynthiibacter]MBS9715930.1 ABC transporter permease [Pseudohalocynthiibacter aestuariivivens]MCK0102514.1 ABC transporter permease [Pseudohalocynthiibacter sp. F2068]
MDKMPKWADVLLIPFINLLLAFILSGLVILAIGKDPLVAIKTMVEGSFGSTNAWGYTLYYATNYIFTGLAVAIAFHARMFNIGGEGQAAIGGLGVALVCLAVDWPHWTLALPAATIGAAIFGAGWALIPAYLQARRGSHIVITTIMFNFISAALMGYLLVNALKEPGNMAAETRDFPAGAHLPSFHEMLAPFGIEFSKHAPANISFLLALLCCFLFWVLIWRTRLGFAIRSFGHSETAARYAGISPTKIIMISMMISGALAGLMAINNVMGESERLILNSVEGAGFIGIAVALMGRSHPVGVFLAALLFGFLTQGGAELQLWENIPRELVVVIQALVILFTGALDNMVRAPVERLFLKFKKRVA